MQEYLIKFIEWTKLKIRIHISNDEPVYFREKEVWWTSLGINIGYEENGKHANFERPIIVLKKFNKHILWAVPITTKEKKGEYYHEYKYTDKYEEDRGKRWAILIQLRLISSKRLLRKIWTLPDEDFQQIKEKLKGFL